MAEIITTETETTKEQSMQQKSRNAYRKTQNKNIQKQKRLRFAQKLHMETSQTTT